MKGGREIIKDLASARDPYEGRTYVRKSLISLIIFSLLASVIIPMFIGGLALADGVAVTKKYDPVTAKGLSVVDQGGLLWDLTRGDLKVSYTLDMLQFNPPQGNQDLTEVGIYGPGGKEGWMVSGAPGAFKTKDPELFDKTDLLVLRNAIPGDNDEGTYNATDPNTIAPGAWNPYDNRGIWFDRDGVDFAKQDPRGLQEGKNVKTNGVYNVEISIHSVDPAKMTNTMFATVNGIPTGFTAYDANWKLVYVPAGKSFYGDPKQIQVFVNLQGNGVKISNLSATGAPASPVVRWVWPNVAEQGTTLNGMGVWGWQFRNVPSTVQLKNSTSGMAFKASQVTYFNDQLVYADVTIPDNATVGKKWDTRFWHNDDTSITGVATLADSFEVTAAWPVVNSISPNHIRPNSTFTMTITGTHFRNVGMTAMLWRGGEIYKSKSIRYVSPTQVKADFTLPANAYIGADWSATLTNNDDGKYSDLYNQFSVDAKMDVYSNGLFNVIWLRAPWITTAVIYSETNFDATTLFPLGISFGGTFPIACNPTDMNRDGRKDIVLYFWNPSVNLPSGTNTVCLDGATGGFRRIKAFDTVRVLKLFW